MQMRRDDLMDLTLQEFRWVVDGFAAREKNRAKENLEHLRLIMYSNIIASGRAKDGLAPIDIFQIEGDLPKLKRERKYASSAEMKEALEIKRKLKRENVRQ